VVPVDDHEPRRRRSSNSFMISECGIIGAGPRRRIASSRSRSSSVAGGPTGALASASRTGSGFGLRAARFMWPKPSVSRPPCCACFYATGPWLTGPGARFTTSKTRTESWAYAPRRVRREGVGAKLT
jgi:hypothetical protein